MKISTKNNIKLSSIENEYPINEFVSADDSPTYTITPSDNSVPPTLYEADNMWRYFHFLPIQDSSNIVTLGEGRTNLVRIPELEGELNGAKLYCKNEGENPTGTFKDREAAYVISKAKELGIKRIAFHSTGNTGRAYAIYAHEVGIESFFFLPISCMDKCDSRMMQDDIHIIAVDGPFKDVGAVGKAFAKKNGISYLAPLHDKIEGKATLAYEQYEELPEATMYVQTIAGGYGLFGYLLGHKRLKEAGIEPSDYSVPKIIAIQAEDNCTIAKGLEVGRSSLTESDLLLPEVPFETTLQSSNPLKTFSEVKDCLDQTNGLIAVANIEEVKSNKEEFEMALSKNGINLSYDNEKSPYISYAGLKDLAKKGQISSNDIIYFVLTGRGRNQTDELKPETIVGATKDGYTVISSSEFMKGLL